MSRDASISFAWADSDYTFRLGIGQLRELQERADCGPEEMYHRLDAGTWRHSYITETIRLGLIGGGTTPDKARSLVRDYVEKRPLLENVRPAMEILAALLIGAPDEPSKKRRGGDEPEARVDLPDGKLNFGDIYGTGAIMGFSPDQVDRMSLWQLNAAAAGFSEAHGSKMDAGLSEDEFQEISGWLDGG